MNSGVAKGAGYLAYKAASASKTLYFELQTNCKINNTKISTSNKKTKRSKICTTKI